MGSLGSMFHRLTRPPDEIREENLEHWTKTLAGVSSIGDVQPRLRCRVAGVVQNIRIDPRRGVSIEATIIDGTGSMSARWLGRASLQGIRLGTGLIVEGTAGRADDGSLMILNPDYDIVPGPEHG